MARDARAVLDKKRKQRQLANASQNRWQSNSTRVSDARQLLKLKKLQGIQKAKMARQNAAMNPTWKKNQRPFNRPFIQNVPKQAFRKNFTGNAGNIFRSQNRISFNQKFQVPNKTVQVARGGILKVTSRTQSQPKSNATAAKSVRFVSNLSGITVTTKNRPSPGHMIVDDDSGDELEHMTLKDIPEISNMRDVPRNLVLQKKTVAPVHLGLPSTSKSTLFSRLAKSMENTMIADTVPTATPLVQPSWKVVVTNLQASVTDNDIVELFGHVGAIKSAEMAQPGMAIIEYYSKDDAVRAYELYHNRLLDGFPMHCVLQPESGRSTVTSRLGERYVPRSSRSSTSSTSSILNPSSRRVAFTVQLP